MKIIVLALILLFAGFILGAVFSGNDSRVLTQQEWLSLKIREQNQHTHIISSADPEALQLLHSRSRAVDSNSPHMDTLIKHMRMAVIANHGLGLAAVQIGVPVRVVLMQQSLGGKDVFKVFINPEILSKSPSTQIFREACLSLLDHDDHLIERSIALTISYQTIGGQTVVEDVMGLDAAVFQQEIDHLNGILIMDYPDLE